MFNVRLRSVLELIKTSDYDQSILNTEKNDLNESLQDLAIDEREFDEKNAPIRDETRERARPDAQAQTTHFGSSNVLTAVHQLRFELSSGHNFSPYPLYNQRGMSNSPII
jgi:hypothetical protein